MKYINVAMGTKFEDKITRMTGNTLASIWTFINSPNFKIGNTTHEKRKEKLLDFIQTVIKPAGSIVTIDSGGYSVLTGMVPFNQISGLEDYYLHILEEERNTYDNIFSLDIAWGINDIRLQEEEIVDALSFRTAKKTFDVLERHPKIKDKFYYIYHFKTFGQYQIWQNHYKHFEIGERITHRAIGGLVGLKGNAPWANFTPFTAMLYKCFWDFVSREKIEPEFKIHILGIYIPHERFVIALVEKIFKLYFKKFGWDTTLQVTYDTTSYVQTELKNYNSLHFWTIDNGKPVKRNYHKISESVLKRAYGDDLGYIQAEIEKLKQGARKSDTSDFVPLSVYTQIELDDYLLHLIDKHHVIEKLDFIKPLKTSLSNRGSSISIQAIVKELRSSLGRSYKDIFNNKLFTDLLQIRSLSYWLFESQVEAELEEMIEQAIDRIDYPYYLV
jgi:hypothetical protein